MAPSDVDLWRCIALALAAELLGKELTDGEAWKGLAVEMHAELVDITTDTTPARDAYNHMRNGRRVDAALAINRLT